MTFIAWLFLFGEVFLTLRAQGYNCGNSMRYGGECPRYVPYPYTYGMGVGPYVEPIVDYVMPVTGLSAEDYDDVIMTGNTGVTRSSLFDDLSPVSGRIGFGGSVPTFGTMASNYRGLAYPLPTALPTVNIPTAFDNYNSMGTNSGKLATGLGDLSTRDLTTGFGDFTPSYNSLPNYNNMLSGYKNLLPPQIDTPKAKEVMPVIGNIKFGGKVRAHGKLKLVGRFGCK